MRRATIKDVAQEAGVGKVTVSYVLNGLSRSTRISEETEKRVLAAAQALNYRPNGIARMLVTRRSQTLAVLFQYADLFTSGSGFIGEAMRGVCAAAVEKGFDLMLHTKPVENPEVEADVLSDGRVDGVLVLRDRGDRTVRALLDREFPCVLFFTRDDDERAAWVDADNVRGGEIATQHLVELGHRRIAMVAGPSGSVAAADRFLGYETAMRRAGLHPDRDPIRCGSPREVSERLQPLLASPTRPTALFVWSDEVAVAALDLARRLGIEAPREISIVGFDSLEICDRTFPKLTSVRQPIFDMADEATRLLAAICQGESPPERKRIHNPTLDIRGSTAPVRFA